MGYERITAQRARLEKNLNRRAECHMKLSKNSTIALLEIFQKKKFGLSKRRLTNKWSTKKFDDFWNEWQPKLQEHYVCSLKCSVKVTTSSLKLSYKWNLCAPCVESCRFYVC